LRTIEILFFALQRLFATNRHLDDALRTLRHRLGYARSSPLPSHTHSLHHSGALSIAMGLLSCNVLSDERRSSAFASRSVLDRGEEGSDEEGVVRYHGSGGGGGVETTYDTLPSLHPLRDDTTSESPVPFSLPHYAPLPLSLSGTTQLSHREIFEELSQHLLSGEGDNEVLRYLLEVVMRPPPPHGATPDGVCSMDHCWCTSASWLPGASTLSHLLTMISLLYVSPPL
jgi:hypothetical protein